MCVFFMWKGMMVLRLPLVKFLLTIWIILQTSHDSILKICTLKKMHILEMFNVKSEFLF